MCNHEFFTIRGSLKWLFDDETEEVQMCRYCYQIRTVTHIRRSKDNQYVWVEKGTTKLVEKVGE
jgi:hypothetical protein